MYSNQILAAKIKQDYIKSHKASEQGLCGFLNNVVIDCLPEPKKFGKIIEEWQKVNIFEPLIPAFEQVAGVNKGKEYSGPLNFFFVLPKGHDKTSAQARLISYCLAYGKRPSGLKIYSGAADLDQSRLILESMVTEAKLNPWYKSRLLFRNKNCYGPGGSLSCLTSEASSNAGIKPDVIIIDEITRHHNKDLYDELMVASAKRKHCIVVIITNAGVRDSWQWDELQKAKANPNKWHVYEMPQGVRLATWMDDDRVADLKKSLPKGIAARLYDNRWTDPGEEDGYLLRHEIEECEKLGEEIGCIKQIKGEKKHNYFASVDYGPTKDRTALAVCHYDKERDIIILDKLDIMQGSILARVRIDNVERWIEEVNRDFHYPTFIIDQYQMESTIQKYEGRYKMERFEFRGGKKNYDMAECLKTLVVNRKIAFYKLAGCIILNDKRHTLIDELAELIIRAMSYGYRFDHESGKHDDRAVAVGMAALFAIREKGASILPPKPQDTEKPKVNPIDVINKFNATGSNVLNPFERQ